MRSQIGGYYRQVVEEQLVDRRGAVPAPQLITLLSQMLIALLVRLLFPLIVLRPERDKS